MSNGSNPTTSQQALALRAQQTFGALPSNIAPMVPGQKINDELAGGITGGFAIVTLRGKVWRIKHRGDEKVMTNENGEPKYSLEVILVKASDKIAKVFYEQGYTEGSNAPPDCWSVDGRVPDPASPSLVAGRTGPTCAGCWANAWGSRTGPGTGKGKACADSKRLAIVPLEDPQNEFFGGPMLLRIPPASLADVKTYADALAQMGYPYFAVATRISFDMTAEYPRLQFKPIRALSEDEAAVILGQRDSALVDRILNTAIDHVETDGQDKTHGLEFEQPPAAMQQPVPRAAAPMAPVAPRPAPAAPQPIPQAPVVTPPPAPPAPPQQPTVENTPKVTLPEGWMALPDGKFYEANTGKIHLEIPTAPAPLPVELVKLPDGNFYDPTTGEIVRPSDLNQAAPAAPQQEAAPAAPKRTRAPKPKAEPVVQSAPQPEPAAAPQQADEPELPLAEGGVEVPPDFDNILDGMLG